MPSKKIKIAAVSVIFIAVSILAALAFMPMMAKANKQALADYYDSINYQCETASDCEVKNVGNCCGAYPACVNKDTVVDPSIVEKNCQKSDMASICGYEEVHVCQCVENRCQNSSGLEAK